MELLKEDLSVTEREALEDLLGLVSPVKPHGVYWIGRKIGMGRTGMVLRGERKWNLEGEAEKDDKEGERDGEEVGENNEGKGEGEKKAGEDEEGHKSEMNEEERDENREGEANEGEERENSDGEADEGDEENDDADDEVAIKLMPIRTIGGLSNGSKLILPRFAEEIRAHQSLPPHLHLPRLLSSHVVLNSVWIVTSHIRGVPLSVVLHRIGSLNPQEVAAVGRGVLSALRHLHTHGITHRDLTPNNVMVALPRHGSGGGVSVKVIDLGTALTGHPRSQHTGEVGTAVHYQSPEMLAGRPNAPACDMWAFGILLYTLLFQHPPYSDQTPDEVKQLILENRKPEIPSNIDPDFKHVLDLCLNDDPEKRVSPESLLKHRFFSEGEERSAEILKDVMARCLRTEFVRIMDEPRLQERFMKEVKEHVFHQEGKMKLRESMRKARAMTRSKEKDRDASEIEEHAQNAQLKAKNVTPQIEEKSQAASEMVTNDKSASRVKENAQNAQNAQAKPQTATFQTEFKPYTAPELVALYKSASHVEETAQTPPQLETQRRGRSRLKKKNETVPTNDNTPSQVEERAETSSQKEESYDLALAMDEVLVDKINGL